MNKVVKFAFCGLAVVTITYGLSSFMDSIRTQENQEAVNYLFRENNFSQ
jgi:hypothetical protein